MIDIIMVPGIWVIPIFVLLFILSKQNVLLLLLLLFVSIQEFIVVASETLLVIISVHMIISTNDFIAIIF